MSPCKQAMLSRNPCTEDMGILQQQVCLMLAHDIAGNVIGLVEPRGLSLHTRHLLSRP